MQEEHQPRPSLMHWWWNTFLQLRQTLASPLSTHSKQCWPIHLCPLSFRQKHSGQKHPRHARSLLVLKPSTKAPGSGKEHIESSWHILLHTILMQPTPVAVVLHVGHTGSSTVNAIWKDTQCNSVRLQLWRHNKNHFQNALTFTIVTQSDFMCVMVRVHTNILLKRRLSGGRTDIKGLPHNTPGKNRSHNIGGEILWYDPQNLFTCATCW